MKIDDIIQLFSQSSLDEIKKENHKLAQIYLAMSHLANEVKEIKDSQKTKI